MSSEEGSSQATAVATPAAETIPKSGGSYVFDRLLEMLVEQPEWQELINHHNNVFLAMVG